MTEKFTGICYTNKEGIAIVEAYGNNKDIVLNETLAGALCYGEHKFTIITSINQCPIMSEHFTITDQKSIIYSVTKEEAQQ